MDIAKNIIYNGIIEEKARKMSEYDGRIEELEVTENIADLYSLIVEVYDNSPAQKDVAIDFMNATLTNDFFREAVINRDLNSISFSDDRYKVVFPTSRARVIDIEYTSTTNPDKYSNVEEKDNGDLIIILEKYLSDKSFSNLKELSKHYQSGQSKGFLSYVDTYKKCDSEMLVRLKKTQELKEERKSLHKESSKIYNMEMFSAIEFLETLTDLKVYEQAGWKINLKELGRNKIVN